MFRTGYHLVDISPWPFSGALGVLGMTTSLVGYLHRAPLTWVCFFGFLSLFLLVFTMIRWWSDVVVESTYLGCHTSLVVRNLRVGMVLFILSEVFFFVSFFWAFFHVSIGEISMRTVGQWPPVGVKAIYPWKVPALNTAILLGSGMTVTWAHKAVSVHNKCPAGVMNLNSDSKTIDREEYSLLVEKGACYQKQAIASMALTVGLGAFFMCIQYEEYYMASFTMADSAFGSTFFIMTGFHGMHVLVGTVFLFICTLRLYYRHFSFNHHYFGLDAAIWYWHFVDVVWIGLFFAVYVWGY
uniref:cytochrome c oxidase subunit III n=1 Tax=Mactra quadrangularis TaxID=120570 RepID=UPI001BEF412A|nr:cytochrome c oxidase subunit III [Mactra quadrangularis]QUV72902.1 cytochrome c oxidase subunit 3 [Mactra quadrangularis]ULC79871.1 cytochrome c oxidase subunit III [Mactra quadrangularis]WLS55660.1 cytochrome c oxidase subunit 3 [Mactra quadrangularis]